MTINIVQGISSYPLAQINIVIDVIRAFTVSHYAFENGIKEIILVGDSDNAFDLKKLHPEYLISGETGGLKIDGFDFGNSPHEISEAFLQGKTLIQRTTNGVKAALHALDADHVMVTGFVNAYETAVWAKNLILTSYGGDGIINVIASHPEGDDDLACAEYIRDLLLDEYNNLKLLQENTSLRIIHSLAAKKFLDPANSDFQVLDLVKCLTISKSNFVMYINNDDSHAKIIQRNTNA